jgi:eukaryotic-like serine/threonine-protein kinase
MSSGSRASDTFKPGDLLNNTYRVEGLLGRGGTSEVYRARSEISGRVVALKVLRSEYSGNADFLLLMTREEAIRDIRHDAVVRYSENHRTSDGHVYLVMDYVDGPGLDQKLRDGGMSAEDLLTVAARVTSGLVAAHGRNITHRDLSPDNIILKDGDPAQAVIIDFGIAKDDNPGAETIVGGEFAGKYAYAAPEQLSGKTDPRTDIYSLGALLLAVYRGKPPDVGRNPMEVIRAKQQRLDTEGVPEPLKSLIDRMTDPDPDQRFQTAEEVLEAIDPDLVQPTTLPPRRPTTVPPPPRAGAEPAAQAAPAATAGRGRGGMIAGILVALLAIVGAAGWFSGLIPGLLSPGLPLADPYTLRADYPQGGPLSITGHAPDEETAARLAEWADAFGGSAEVTLARGDIAPTWGTDVLRLIDEIDGLEEWRLSMTGNTATITGMTTNRALHTALSTSLDGPGMPSALTGQVDILLGPVILPAGPLRAVLDAHADCGPLTLVDPPSAGYPMGAQVVVAGQLAGPDSRLALYDALTDSVGDRRVTLDVDVLNPSLCAVEAALPSAASGGFRVDLGFGDRPDPNPAGRYFVGENPVIDIVIPASVTDGYLWVAIVDVAGKVYHLIPNLNREDPSVAALRNGQTGEVAVRVAHSVADAEGTDRLAFLVDDTALGKNKILVLHAASPIFDDTRPTAESAESFADALAERIGNGAFPQITADSRILTTDRP